MPNQLTGAVASVGNTVVIPANALFCVPFLILRVTFSHAQDSVKAKGSL